jgi:hypothetical protein
MTAKNEVDLKIARRLLAAGCPIPFGKEQDEVPEPDLTFEVTQPSLTRAYDSRAGVEYVFAVRVKNQSYTRIQIQRFSAWAPWRCHLYWPGVPHGIKPKDHIYRLESGRKFPSANVLNHRVGDRGNLEPGAKWEGLLLAYSMFSPIPSDFWHNEFHEARISARDQYGRWHSSWLEMQIDRTATMRPPSVRQPGTGLFGTAESGANPISFSVYVPGPFDSGGNRSVRDTEPCRPSLEEAASSESIPVPGSVPASPASQAEAQDGG